MLKAAPFSACEFLTPGPNQNPRTLTLSNLSLQIKCAFAYIDFGVMPFRLDLTGISSNSRIVETDMARKSDGEKIDELISLFAVLDEQVKNLRKEVASIDAI
jgi:hypothetical protein